MRSKLQKTPIRAANKKKTGTKHPASRKAAQKQTAKPTRTETELLKALQHSSAGSTEDFFRSLVVDLTGILRMLSTLVDDSAASVLAAFAARADHELELLRSHRSHEAQLQSSLAEKEALLKEVHHRVKNNLQVITSLLSLQAASVHDPDVLTLLQESQNRVRSMALVHDRFHHSPGQVSIDFGEYIKTMASQLLRSYAKGGVAVAIDVEPLPLGIDTAIPCGLLLNELLSNAVRHAFPDGKSGTITLGFRRTSETTAALTVSDTGVGLPPEMNWRKAETMGMTLIVGLTRQLGGTIDVNTAQGTQFTVTFPAG
jgi:two-component sensor histidine kinase